MVEIQETEPAARTRPAKPRLFSPAAAAVIAVVGLALLPSQDALPAEETSPGEESVAVDLPSPKAEAAPFVEAEAVAASFMAAWVRGDGRAAASLFAAEGKFHGVEPGMLATLHDWYRAVGWEIQGEGCELISPMRTVVSCRYAFENELTRGLGIKPVTGSFRVFVEDGAISWVTDQFDFVTYFDFWRTFMDWVLSTHPDDVQQMYGQSPGVSTYPLLDQTSIALWEQYTDEFVASPYLAQARAICQAATDRLQLAVSVAASAGSTDLEAARHRTAARISQAVLAELRTLPSPPAELEGVHEIPSLIERQTDLLRAEAAAAAAGDRERVRIVGVERESLTRQIRDLVGSCPLPVLG
jgi:hypothetical protein